jgi:hypothetical protein
MRASQWVFRVLTALLSAFGAIVIAALILQRLGTKPAPMHVKLNVDTLCDIEFDIDPLQWEKHQFQVQTWRLTTTNDKSTVRLHVVWQRGAQRELPADCGHPETESTYLTGNGVLLRSQLVKCTSGETSVRGTPSGPQRVYASLEARFVTLRLVVAGDDRADVLRQEHSLVALAQSLKLDACTDLTWSR